MTVNIPKNVRFSSQKHNAIMHKPGTNKPIELNNFRTLVNVTKFLCTSASAITPEEIEYLYSFKNIYSIVFHYRIR
jgi:hypothetical protein